MHKVAGTYRVNYYEQDQPLAVDYCGWWSAIATDERLILNARDDNAVLVHCTILSISHPQLGGIRGLYPVGLDYILVLEDYTQLRMEAEETPGLIYDRGLTLDPASLDILMWRPETTDIPAAHAFAGLTRSEGRMISDLRSKTIREKLDSLAKSPLTANWPS